MQKILFMFGIKEWSFLASFIYGHMLRNFFDLLHELVSWSCCWATIGRESTYSVTHHAKAEMFLHSALISATVGAAKTFPISLCHSVIRAHISKVPSDWVL